MLVARQATSFPKYEAPADVSSVTTLTPRNSPAAMYSVAMLPCSCAVSMKCRTNCGAVRLSAIPDRSTTASANTRRRCGFKYRDSRDTYSRTAATTVCLTFYHSARILETSILECHRPKINDRVIAGQRWSGIRRVVLSCDLRETSTFIV